MKLPRTFLAIAVAALLAACTASGPVLYTHAPGKLLVTELGPDRRPVQSWTVDASTVRIDQATDVLTAPGIPRPLASYTTETP